MSATKLANVGAVVMAAGRGTRLGCVDIPKVMLPVGGKPMVGYIAETLSKMGLTPGQMSVVVGFAKAKVMDYLGNKVQYAFQPEPRGTAHAAFTGMAGFPPSITEVLVLGGDDSAFYTPETLANFITGHMAGKRVLSLLTAVVDDPSQLGRVVRHPDGGIEIIEKEYLTAERKQIKEVSTGTFCFNRTWFETIFPTMSPLRKLGEYGLPTALAIARDTGMPYAIVPLGNNKEWYGVNTAVELDEANHRKL